MTENRLKFAKLLIELKRKLNRHQENEHILITLNDLSVDIIDRKIVFNEHVDDDAILALSNLVSSIINIIEKIEKESQKG